MGLGKEGRWQTVVRSYGVAHAAMQEMMSFWSLVAVRPMFDHLLWLGIVYGHHPGDHGHATRVFTLTVQSVGERSERTVDARWAFCAAAALASAHAGVY